MIATARILVAPPSDAQPTDQLPMAPCTIECDPRLETLLTESDKNPAHISQSERLRSLKNEPGLGLGWGNPTPEELASSFLRFCHIRRGTVNAKLGQLGVLLPSSIVCPAFAEHVFIALSELYCHYGPTFLQRTARVLATQLLVEAPIDLMVGSRETNDYFIAVTATLSIFAPALTPLCGGHTSEMHHCPHTAAWHAMVDLFKATSHSEPMTDRVLAYLDYLMQQPIFPNSALDASKELAEYVERQFPTLYQRGLVSTLHPLYRAMNHKDHTDAFCKAPMCHQELCDLVTESEQTPIVLDINMDDEIHDDVWTDNMLQDLPLYTGTHTGRCELDMQTVDTRWTSPLRVCSANATTPTKLNMRKRKEAASTNRPSYTHCKLKMRLQF